MEHNAASEPLHMTFFPTIIIIIIDHNNHYWVPKSWNILSIFSMKTHMLKKFVLTWASEGNFAWEPYSLCPLASLELP